VTTANWTYWKAREVLLPPDPVNGLPPLPTRRPNRDPDFLPLFYRHYLWWEERVYKPIPAMAEHLGIPQGRLRNWLNDLKKQYPHGVTEAEQARFRERQERMRAMIAELKGETRN
jgi:hypothetical protein